MNEQNRIQYYRKRQGLSQEELGERLYVSRQTVSQWETGQTMPSIDSLVRLREIFGASVDDLLGLTTSPEETVPPDTTDEPLAAPYVFRYTEADLHALNRIHRRRPLIGLIATIVLTVFVWIVSFAKPGWQVILVFLLACCLFTIARYRAVKQTERRIHAECLTRVYAYTLLPQGIRLAVTDECDATYRYCRMLPSIKRVRICGDVLVAYIDDGFYSFRLSELSGEEPLRAFLLAAPTATASARERRRAPQALRVLSIVLMVLSVAALWGGVIVAGVVSSEEPGRFYTVQWVCLPLMILPIASVVLGIVLRRMRYGGTLNIVVGVIMCVFLSMFGIAALSAVEFDDPIMVVEQEMGIALPDSEHRSTSAGATFALCTLRLPDADAARFEADADASGLWKEAVPGELTDVQPFETNPYPYNQVLFFNRTANAYNAHPTEEADMVVLYYDRDYNELTIVLYRWEG